MTSQESEIVVVYVTAPEQDAASLARALVEKRLAACVNIIPRVRSFFHWEGSVQDEAESLLVIKTTRRGFERLREGVQQMHPYEVPEIIGLPVERAHPPYESWVVTNVEEGSRSEAES